MVRCEDCLGEPNGDKSSGAEENDVLPLRAILYSDQPDNVLGNTSCGVADNLLRDVSEQQFLDLSHGYPLRNVVGELVDQENDVRTSLEGPFELLHATEAFGGTFYDVTQCKLARRRIFARMLGLCTQFSSPLCRYGGGRRFAPCLRMAVRLTF